MLAEHRVLVVDDQPLVRKVLRTMLISIGFEHVFEAANGAEASSFMLNSSPTW